MEKVLRRKPRPQPRQPRGHNHTFHSCHHQHTGGEDSTHGLKPCGLLVMFDHHVNPCRDRD